ncbi:hypothetical protein GIB67_014106 [Kingdonia uniflora]|uniref:phosphopyruvate hydratase n=1 Tax=Kingdonia uniflora TaxID=39325 RepID=A0A7J7KXJ4_9MAGN|nr:hypothetical protein GIB67_014106 [Kingdonia uniflora]
MRSIPLSLSCNGSSKGIHGYASAGASNSLSTKIKFLCSFGGKILRAGSNGMTVPQGFEKLLVSPLPRPTTDKPNEINTGLLINSNACCCSNVADDVELCCEFTHEGSQRNKKMKMKMSWKGCNASVLQVVRDDLLMSNPKCIEKAIGELTCNTLLLKEIMVLPNGVNSFEEAMQMDSETYHYLKAVIFEKYGASGCNVGEDGGFAPNISSFMEGFDLVVGDELLMPNPKRIKKSISKLTYNALLLKVDQIGTVTEAIEAVKLAKYANWGIVVSHRCGETVDSFIADLAIGLATYLMKEGALCRGERLAKYNELFRIEVELGDEAVYAGEGEDELEVL